jgi:glycosyltransferase involved in cell wall biosynthesis
MPATRAINIPTDAASPLVSVIVPTYNYAHLIDQTLDSVLAQTYRNWECIIVDDGSTDHTADLVAKYAARDPRVRSIHQPNRGQSSARNTGLMAMAGSGEYVQFLDADDLIDSRKLEQQIKYMEAHPEVDIVYGRARYFENDVTELHHSLALDDTPWLPEISGQGKPVLSALVRQNIMVINSPLIRRRVVDAIGRFNEQMLNEDWEYWLRCAASGQRFQFEDLPGTRAFVRVHPQSSSYDRSRMYRDCRKLRASAAAIIKDQQLLELNRQLAADLEALIRREEVKSGVAQVENGQWPKAMGTFTKIGNGSKTHRERFKWFFCALVAPFAPRNNFHSIIEAPAGQSILKILRYHFGGTSATVKK